VLEKWRSKQRAKYGFAEKTVSIVFRDDQAKVVRYCADAYVPLTAPAGGQIHVGGVWVRIDVALGRARGIAHAQPFSSTARTGCPFFGGRLPSE
jgi:hypothetical protein